MLEAWIESTRRAAQSLRVRSALNPMLWLTAIAMPTCLAGAYLFREAPAVAAGLVFVATIPVLVTCAGFAYFATQSPEKLQSEDYQIRHESLQLIQAKSGAIVVDTTSIAAIANPAMAALPGAKEGAK